MFQFMLFKVLGKCQLKEAVQDKIGGLDSIGNVFTLIYQLTVNLECVWYIEQYKQNK